MQIKNNALINNPDLAAELAKGLPLAAGEEGVLETAGALPAIIEAADPELKRQPAKWVNPTKSPYNFEREKARRKAASRSRKVNRRK